MFVLQLFFIQMCSPLKHLSWLWFKLMCFKRGNYVELLSPNIFNYIIIIILYIIIQPLLIIQVLKRCGWWLVLLATSTSRYFGCFINEIAYRIVIDSIIVYLLSNILCCTLHGLC